MPYVASALVVRSRSEIWLGPSLYADTVPTMSD